MINWIFCVYFLLILVKSFSLLNLSLESQVWDKTHLSGFWKRLMISNMKKYLVIMQKMNRISFFVLGFFLIHEMPGGVLWG